MVDNETNDRRCRRDVFEGSKKGKREMLRRMDSLVPIDYNDMMDTAYRHGNGKHETNDRNDEAVSARFPPLCDDSDAREGKKRCLTKGCRFKSISRARHVRPNTFLDAENQLNNLPVTIASRNPPRSSASLIEMAIYEPKPANRERTGKRQRVLSQVMETAF